jgi:hypothetical protein
MNLWRGVAVKLVYDPATGEKIGFGINYLKGKWLKIGLLRYPENRKLWWKKCGGLDHAKYILIQDVIGFFQSAFLTAMEGKEEQDLIDWGKPLRSDFSNQRNRF